MNPSSAITSAVSPGILGFLVIAAIGLALFLLLKSMNRHIAKIEVPFEADFKKADQKKRVDFKKPKENGTS
ncbi:hypothetical protein [Sinosporangium siamense]|uniref:Uncharacterized protein n=1 Tax=Sinosporangium siamense TaxID=1367973 RepID=A0A919RIW7_9ACTN|nr:hypothetical protein [Sinosporangium siamense]GII93194.1 hypothetical protein Ssi02_34250 [Sinosporangium siamense]